MPQIPNAGDSLSGEGGLAAQAMNILGSLHAAIVNFHLYPSTSDIVEDSIRRALEDLKQALETTQSITFCETEGRLLINDFSLDERDMERPNTLAFLRDLAMWGVRSITFERGLEDMELRNFLEIFSRKRADRTMERGLEGYLAEGGIRNVKVDEKIYVPMGRDEDVAGSGEGGANHDAMELLKDEVFVRYLLGKVSSEETSLQEVSQLVSDPKQVNMAFQSVMQGFEGSGGAVGRGKAHLIRDTVDRMYGLVEKVADFELKEALNREMINILAALEPETLMYVLTDEAPQVVKEREIRRGIISTVGGENVFQLTDQIIEKYQGLLASRADMDAQEFQEITSLLNEIIADLYQEGDPSCHPEITRRLRDSGLLLELARSHLEAGKDIETYAVITEIRASGSLRTLEGLSDEDVIKVAGRLLDMGERDITRKIIDASSRNLVSERPDFRVRACRFLKELHLDFRARGHGAELLDRGDELVAILEEEEDPEVQEGLIQLLGYIANDLFVEERLVDFERISMVLVSLAEEARDDRIKWSARAGLSLLNPWDIGRPLADSLYGEDERLGNLAARVLPYIEESLTAKEIANRLRDEEEINITPQLAQVCNVIGEPVLDELNELMGSNVREEVCMRVLSLLELIDRPAALSMVKSAETHPIPLVRAQAMRSMCKMAPGDPSLLPHFLKALSDEDIDVRREGARGLGTIDDPRSVESLLSVAQGRSPGGGLEHPRVQEVACLALAKLGPDKALPLLSDLLRKRPFALRRHAVHPRVKAASCYALGQIGGREVVDLIKGFLEDTDPIVRNEARKALSELRKRGYVD